MDACIEFIQLKGRERLRTPEKLELPWDFRSKLAGKVLDGLTGFSGVLHDGLPDMGRGREVVREVVGDVGEHGMLVYRLVGRI